MIPRYQRVLFWLLLVLCGVMTVFLIYTHHRNQETADLSADDTPIAAPDVGAAENVTYVVARDADGTLTSAEQSIALPSVPAVRARALLEHLLADYALPTSQHPLPGGIAVEDVFLVPLPLTAPRQTGNTGGKPQLPDKTEDADELTHVTGELAVINLRSSWVTAHPSGVEAETLTVLSILGTLHASMPEITHVRFLVDGQTRDTLAGHVNLSRVYESADTTSTPQ
ncbi:MAG: GerMN domain-containing protein [Acidobacteria bacterium]|nr:GerMN domain-containing protein [Acidobacteriota bacterium]